MVWIPVVLTLVMGPGMGQFYNREYKKGAYLLVLSLVLFMASAAWLKNILVPYLPSDITTEDPFELSRMIQENSHKAAADHAGVLFVYFALITGVWIYSVYDAYKGGKRRQAQDEAKKAAILKMQSPKGGS